MKNEAGFLSLDFIFALTIVIGFTVVLFALTFTLSIVEIAQYITFSSARSYYAAHFTVDDQVSMGNRKYQELLEQPAIKPLFRPGGWFELRSGDKVVGDYNSIYQGAGVQSTGSGYSFFGSRVTLVANLMDLRFPIIGTTSDGQGFSANVSSFLSREPTEQECREGFENLRYKQIMELSNIYKNPANDGSGFVPIMDNGC